MDKEILSVIGAGSWGTALACALARNGHTVRLWGRNQALMQAMRQDRVNQTYLPGVTLASNIEPTPDLEVALQNCSALIVAVPSHSFASALHAISPHITSYTDILSASKGVSSESLFPDQVCAQILGPNQPFAVISGPSFAKEVAQSLPTATTIACQDASHANRWVERFHQSSFRVYTNQDLIGTQLGGTVKNIIAIAAGIASGLGYGANAQAALMTRGLAEIIRFGTALGANSETLMGLGGLGDLILTCSDNQSRNRRFGLALSTGKPVAEIQAEIGQAIEGYHNAKQIYQMTQNLNIDTPIIDQVYRVLYEDLPIAQAVQELFMRSPKPE